MGHGDEHSGTVAESLGDGSVPLGPGSEEYLDVGYYDQKAKYRCFAPGDEVLVLLPIQGSLM